MRPYCFRFSFINETFSHERQSGTSPTQWNANKKVEHIVELTKKTVSHHCHGSCTPSLCQHSQGRHPSDFRFSYADVNSHLRYDLKLHIAQSSEHLSSTCWNWTITFFKWVLLMGRGTLRHVQEQHEIWCLRICELIDLRVWSMCRGWLRIIKLALIEKTTIPRID